MPLLKHHQSRKVTKLLNMGYPGSGKTYALACFPRAGYRLIIVDFDNGLDILLNLLMDDKEAMDRVYFETFTDSLKAMVGSGRTTEDTSGNVQVPMIVSKGSPKAMTGAMRALTEWKFPIEKGSKETYNLGNIGDWDDKTIVVIDSLGLAGQAAMRFIKQLNKHQFDMFSSKPDYGQAMEMLEKMLMLLYSDGVQCNVIVNTHVTLVEDPRTGQDRGLPRALGSKLPPNVGGYFNTVVYTEASGSGQNKKHWIHTVSENKLELKLPVKPGVIPARLPTEDGLLTIFRKLQSEPWKEEEVKAEKE